MPRARNEIRRLLYFVGILKSLQGLRMRIVLSSSVLIHRIVTHVRVSVWLFLVIWRHFQFNIRGESLPQLSKTSLNTASYPLRFISLSFPSFNYFPALTNPDQMFELIRLKQVCFKIWYFNHLQQPLSVCLQSKVMSHCHRSNEQKNRSNSCCFFLANYLKNIFKIPPLLWNVFSFKLTDD